MTPDIAKVLLIFIERATHTIQGAELVALVAGINALKEIANPPAQDVPQEEAPKTE